MAFSMIVDTSRCTACRGCQVACKQWNQLPGTKTKQFGSYQNPADLSGDTWKLVRFAEGRKDNGKPYWNFFSDSCRHCIEAPCRLVADMSVEGAILEDAATGAVLFTEKTRELPLEDIREACPYDIPRQRADKLMTKCTMCFDRITNDRIPSCALSCPTGAIVFGKREDILKEVDARVEKLKATNPRAKAINAKDVRVIFIVEDDPRKYHARAAG